MVAKSKNYNITNIHKVYTLYPYFAVEAIFLFFQINILSGNYNYVAYSSFMKNGFIYSLLVPIIFYGLYKPALLGSAGIIFGTMLNNFVIAQNGGKMPVFASLSKWTGYFNAQAIQAVNGIHTIGNAQTKFWFLSDFIDVGFSILSIGDIFIHAFTFIIIFNTIKAVDKKSRLSAF